MKLRSQMMSCLYVDRDRSGPNHIGVSELVKQRMEAEAEGLTGVESRPLLLFPEVSEPGLLRAS